MIQNKRLFIAMILVFTLAISFWTGSRYPQLNEKAQMGGQTQTMGLSFDFVHIILLEDTYASKIFYNTLNWIETNKKGMIFGLLFAAALILVFNELKDTVSENRWKNAGIGMIIGAPLGVCVNCATPIAQGIKKSGGKAETALATLMSSPTLNFIVLGMLFSLVPLHLVLTKLALSFLFIIVGIPLILKLFPVKEDQKMESKLTEAEGKALKPMGVALSYSTDTSWWGSFTWVFKNYFRALWYIGLRTLPFMLLAGILGNVLVTFVPLDFVLAMLDLDFGNVFKTFAMLFTVAIICTFFPVPMAFDVVITVILIAAGLPMRFAAVILFTLGIFSIYPYIIVSRVVSFKVASTIYLSVALLGVICGFTAHYIDVKFWQDELNAKYAQFDASEVPPSVRSDVEFVNASDVINSINPGQYSAFLDTLDISVSRKKFAAIPPGDTTANRFRKMNGSKLGFNLPYEYSINYLVENQSHHQSISATDLNKDNWVDIAMTTDKSVFLFLNKDGESFVEYQRIKNDTLEFHGVNTEDLNNDGWADLFINTYQKGSYYILSEAGVFDPGKLKKVNLPKDPAFTLSCAFADLDLNGQLDVFMGSWSVGAFGKGYYEDSKNYLVMNVVSDASEVISLADVHGETLTSLFSDFDMDGTLDLIVGNDYFDPDLYYLGTKPFTGFKLVQRSDSIIPVTSRFSMSSVTADINNDLIPEIYSIQLGGSVEKQSRVENQLSICSGIEDDKKRKDCENFVYKNVQFIKSYTSRDFDLCPEGDAQECHATIFANHFMRSDPSELGIDREGMVELYNSDQYKYYQYESGYHHADWYEYPESETGEMLPQKPFGAVLLMKKSLDEPFVDVSGNRNIPYTGWSWNSKMADVNNDEYLDIYVANGFNLYMFVSAASNIFYENVAGETYMNKTKDSGLEDLLPTQTYSYLDYNNDGRLDIITNPQIGGEMMVFENVGSAENHSVMFEIIDELGNTGAIGAKVYLRYGDNEEKAQMREIQSGGGFKSFDERVLHFGLGAHTSASSLEVHWYSGEKTVIKKNFESGYRYRVVRKPNSELQFAGID